MGAARAVEVSCATHPEPPPPLPNETYLEYARRYLRWSEPAQLNPQWLKWNARKVWTGQTVEELRDLIESEQSVPNECFLVNHNPQ